MNMPMISVTRIMSFITSGVYVFQKHNNSTRQRKQEYFTWHYVLMTRILHLALCFNTHSNFFDEKNKSNYDWRRNLHSADRRFTFY